MPKVDESYKIDKRQQIIKAAVSVCGAKPIYEVTMRDVIVAAGVSQGGVYRYFADIDDVLVAVVNTMHTEADYRAQVDALIQKSSSPQDALRGMFAFLGDYMATCPAIVGKFQFELKQLFANHPERWEKIMPRIAQQQSGQHLMEQISRTVLEGVQRGHFHPTVPVETLFALIGATIDGIVENLTLQNYYGALHARQAKINPVALLNALAEAVIRLLTQRQKGGNEE